MKLILNKCVPRYLYTYVYYICFTYLVIVFSLCYLKHNIILY